MCFFYFQITCGLCVGECGWVVAFLRVKAGDEFSHLQTPPPPIHLSVACLMYSRGPLSSPDPVCPSRLRCGDLQCFHNEAELKNELLFQKKGKNLTPTHPHPPPSVAALVLLL